jgi:hypothetical protein
MWSWFPKSVALSLEPESFCQLISVRYVVLRESQASGGIYDDTFVVGQSRFSVIAVTVVTPVQAKPKAFIAQTLKKQKSESAPAPKKLAKTNLK